ncbi:amino acid adenylation domain-containing protein, partial [Endozoicomonas sp. SM1973]
GDKRLVAYVVPNKTVENEGEWVQQLRQDLKAQLPDFMLPGAFAVLPALPTTPNGKVDRKALPEATLTVTDNKDYKAPITANERVLHQVWQDVLGIKQVSIDDNFFEIGGDSILALQVITRSLAAGLKLTMAQLFEQQTIVQLACEATVVNTSDKQVPQTPSRGKQPLLPIQRQYLEATPTDVDHYNQAVKMDVPNGITALQLKQSLAAIYQRHDVFRLRFHWSNNGGWQAEYVDLTDELIDNSVSVVELAGSEAPNSAIEATLNQIHGSLSIDKGILGHCLLVHNHQGQSDQLFWIIHHLIVDGVSWRVLLRDLENSINLLQQNKSVVLDYKTASYQYWAERLVDYSQSEALTREKPYWINTLNTEVVTLASKIINKHKKYANTNNVSADVRVVLDKAQTQRLLKQSHQCYRTQINDLLLSALLMTITDWVGGESIRLDLEGHGRQANLFDDINISDTMGWFTSIFPVCLTQPINSDLGILIKSVKEQLKAIPNHGLGFGLLRYLKQEKEIVNNDKKSEIIFNYLGQMDQTNTDTKFFNGNFEDTGLWVSPAQEREYRLEINSVVAAEQLTIIFSYNKLEFGASVIEQLASSYISHLSTIIDHCCTASGGYTPSDFSLVDTTQSYLDSLESRYPAFDDLYPSTPMQQGMLFHSQMQSECDIYTSILTVHFSQVEPGLLKQCWQKLIERYDVLRTAFIDNEQGEILQVIERSVILPWQEIDWRGLTESEQTHQLTLFVDQEQTKLFRFDTAPLMRFTLIRKTDERYALVWTHHHTLLDGWSIPILFTELFDIYQSLKERYPVKLTQPIPFRSYMAWLHNQDVASAEAYWQDYLTGFSDTTPVLLEHEVKQKKEGYCEKDLHFSASHTQQLVRFTQNAHVTINTVVQAAWGVLLSLYSGQQDVVFGYTCSGRSASLAHAEDMVGLFINTLPLRVQLPTSHTAVESWLQSLNQTQAVHDQYSYIPLVDIQRLSEIPSGHSLFESIVVFENYPIDELCSDDEATQTTPDLQIENIGVSEQTNYPLNLIVTPGKVLELKLLFDQARFSVCSAEKLLNHLQRILLNLITKSGQTVADMTALVTAEEQQLLAKWNQTTTDYPREHCIHELFENQVTNNPNTVAIVYEGQQLTYAELNKKANQLAHYLVAQGVKPEALVGLCAERSFDMIVGLLAILKAGGSYVPIDPSYPTDRLALLIKDSGVQLILSQAKLAKVLPSLQADILYIDTHSTKEVLKAYSINNIESEVLQLTPQHLAYVIYTSGSTGKPKGVLVPHQGVTRLVMNNHQVPVNAQTVMLQCASITFDAATLELWGPLLNGGQLVLYPESIVDVQRLIRVINEYQVNTLWLTAGLFDQFVADSTQPLPSLQYLLTGGDVVSPKSVNKFYEQNPDAIIINGYGPTENTTFTCCYAIPRDIDFNQPLPIGRPIANTQVYVLNNNLVPVPIGIPGELYTSGDGVARGYLNQPELTAEKFVQNPFSRDPKQRLYKTGDWVCWLPDGKIRFIGRADNQVKIRGFRIELGEIENVLSRHDQVKDVVVLAREDQPGDKRLVAYVVLSTTSAVFSSVAETLSSYVKQLLPGYMVPHHFIQLVQLPLTSNGKVDRQSLPMPNYSSQVDYVAPTSAIEKQLVNIWKAVLGLEQISIHANFFTVGGDSIKAIQVASRAQREGLKLTTRQLFTHSTIAELAVYVTAQALDDVKSNAPVVGVQNLLPIQHHFLTTQPEGVEHFNQGTRIRLPNNVSDASLRQLLSAIIERHDVFRLGFEYTTDGNWQAHYQTLNESLIQQALFQLDVTGFSADQRNIEEADWIHRLQTRFDLASPPLCHWLWLKDQASSELVWIVHHLVVDGVSWRILLQDLKQGLMQLATGQALDLGYKTTSYQLWGERLSAYSKSAQGLEEACYWQQACQQAVNPLPAKPLANPSSNNDQATDVHTVKLSQSLTQQLLLQANGCYHTQINDLLLTALLLTITEWTTGQSIRVDLEGHGREPLFDDIDLTETVGWFTSIFPVYLTKIASDKPCLGEQIKHVKEQLRQIPNKGIGYGLLQRWAPEQLASSQSAELVFNYLGQFDEQSTDDDTDSVTLISSELEGCISPLLQRSHILGMNSMVFDGQWQLTIDYHREQFSEHEIKLLGQSYLKQLENIIAHCVNATGSYTPSDFPLVSLTQAQLNQLQANYPGLEDLYPSTLMQQGMLLHSELGAENGIYMTQLAVKLSQLNPVIFKQSWQALIKRHSILRTAFVYVDDQPPLQVVQTEVDLPWQTLDWQHLDAKAQIKAIHTLLAEASPYDQAQAPLMSFHLAHCGDDQYWFVWQHHHALLDGWCLPILFKELFAQYQGLIEQRPVELPFVAPYRNYLAWLQQQDSSQAEQYWKHYLAGFTMPTSLGIEQSVTSQQGLAQQEYTVDLSPDLTKQLQQLANSLRVTLNTLLQAAWGILLSRYSGEQDVVFGSTRSGRPDSLPGVEQMIGLFINSVPVRLTLTGEIPLAECLQQLQQAQVSHDQYAYSPLVDIQRWSDIDKGQALFNSLIVFDNYPIEEASDQADQPGQPTIDQVLGAEQTNYPLTLSVIPGEPITLKLLYQTARFAKASITQLITYFHQLLLQLTKENSQAPIAQFNLLSDKEAKQLAEWNQTAAPFPSHKNIHELFEMQVMKTPNAIALAFEERQLTYDELNKKANQLAHYLVEQGVKPDTLVAVYLERSIEMVIAILAVVKAGGAYVPLETSYPEERLVYMIENSQAKIILTQHKLKTRLTLDNQQLLCLDAQTIANQLASYPVENISVSSIQLMPSHLAYVIYTSGSTGKPKGVMNEHQALVNRIHWMQNQFNLSTADVVLQKTPFGFDVSVWELFWPLTYGAKLVVALPDGHKDVDYLLDTIERANVTVMHFVPPMLNVLIANQQFAEKTHSLRLVVCSGEALPIETQNKFISLHQAALFNLYGPTEAAIDVTYWQCQLDDSRLSVPIGKPIDNIQLLVLDHDRNLAPIGIPGELHIGGVGVARGYLNRPDLTAEKFIQNPFSDDPSDRLYRTGDLVRWLPDGNLAFIGRI